MLQRCPVSAASSKLSKDTALEKTHSSNVGTPDVFTVTLFRRDASIAEAALQLTVVVVVDVKRSTVTQIGKKTKDPRVRMLQMLQMLQISVDHFTNLRFFSLNVAGGYGNESLLERLLQSLEEVYYARKNVPCARLSNFASNFDVWPGRVERTTLIVKAMNLR